MAARSSAMAKPKFDPDALGARLSAAPVLADESEARRRLDDLLAEEGAEALRALAEAPEARGLLEGLADHSPFLFGLIDREPDRAVRALSEPPERSVAEIVSGMGAAWRGDRAELAAALRKGRAEAALTIAMADIGGVWSGAEATAALSDVAEAAIRSATRFSLREAYRSGKLILPDPERPEEGSGFFILGMGKLGARELNYSSDVDLIAFFDTEVSQVADAEEITAVFVRVAQTVGKLLQERTADGYVARVDFRLRPDPGSTPVAISRDAALSYYESVGQNWERAAMIKARVVAGDEAAGELFLKEMRPFIWRRSLDHAAIADIHAMKRQIHAHKGHGQIAVEGHNLKLGRGGIREIEFFAQTQQLVAGGRDPDLRARGTIETLARLVETGWITSTARDALVDAYWFLRGLEHRLQMVADEQTHTLPEEEAELVRFAKFAGYEDRETFAKVLTTRLKLVQRHYAKLFEDAPDLSSEAGSLVFTGEDDDPDTLKNLSGMGYSEPGSAIQMVRGWHRGRYASMRSARAREILTELAPAILQALAKSGRPDAALNGFDKMLERTSGGVALLALIRAHPEILNLLADVLGAAPRLGETLARRPRVLDALLDPAFFGHLPDRKEIAGRVGEALSQSTTYEDMLDRARIVGQEIATLIGIRVASGAVPADQAGFAFARTADVMVGELFARVEEELVRVHGRVKGGEAAVVALGKLGGEEMTAASDLDLIVLYEHPESSTESNGDRPIAPSQYYARLTQRLTAAISAPTSEGVLYETDFRLRPSGRAGPLATRLKAFESYQAEEAETWEHMALSRARVVAGPQKFRRVVGRAIGKALTMKRDPKKVAKDVSAMRALLDKEKGEGGPWNLKHAPGGIVDIEFVAQALQLAHAHKKPELLFTVTAPAIDRAREAGLISKDDHAALSAAAHLQLDLTQALRLAVEQPFDPEEAPDGLKALLCRIGEAPDFKTLTADLAERQKAARDVFKRTMKRLG